MCDSDTRDKNGWKPKTEGPMYPSGEVVVPTSLGFERKVKVGMGIAKLQGMTALAGVPEAVRDAVEQLARDWSHPARDQADGRAA